MSYRPLSFTDACVLIRYAKFVVIDGHTYDAKPSYDASAPLELVRRFEPDPAEGRLRVLFAADTSAVIEGKTIRMTEEYGEEAFLKLVFDDDATKFAAAEIAAALMDAIHSNVTRQEEGSDSAYAELYEIATEVGGGFTAIWGWVAVMTSAVTEEMEGAWQFGEIEFIESIHFAAQEFHNVVTDPQRKPRMVDDFNKDVALEVWNEALRKQKNYEKKMLNHQPSH